MCDIDTLTRDNDFSSSNINTEPLIHAAIETTNIIKEFFKKPKITKTKYKGALISTIEQIIECAVDGKLSLKRDDISTDLLLKLVHPSVDYLDELDDIILPPETEYGEYFVTILYEDQHTTGTYIDRKLKYNDKILVISHEMSLCITDSKKYRFSIKH